MSRSAWMIAVGLLLVLGALLLAPIAAVVRGAFLEHGQFTLAWFQDVLERQDTLDGLINSILLALASTGICLLISIPLALLAENYRFPGKAVWLALIQAPMILPPFVGAIGLKNLLSRNGGINELLVFWGWLAPDQPIDWLASPFWSCALLIALNQYPILFLNVQAALANLDPALDEAARNLGAGAWRRFWRITLPLMRPGIFAGGTIVFIWSFTDLGTPLMVGYDDVTAVQIFRELETTAPAGDTYALVVILLVVSVLLYAIGKLLLGRTVAAQPPKASVAVGPRPAGPLGATLITLAFGTVFTLAVIPHIGVALESVSRTGMITLRPSEITFEYHTHLLRDLLHFGQGATGGEALAARSVLNSLKYSLLATGFSIVLGFAIGYLVARRKNVLTYALDSLAMLPLAVPGLVMAFGYFVLTQPPSPLAFMNPLKADPLPLLVIAYTVRRLPFMVRSCAAGLEQTSVALEEAAHNLGAGPLRTLWRVVVPLLAANFIAGGMLVFSRSMLEVSDSLMLALDRDTYPMTKAIYDLADQPAAGMQLAAALGVWGMVLLIATIAVASAALGKRLGALFRV